MAKLKQLKEAQEKADLILPFAGKDWEIAPTINQVLDYRAAYADVQNGDRVTDEMLYELVTPLIGGRFNRETRRFEADPENEKYGTTILDLIEAGMTFPYLSRLISTVHAKYEWGDDIAAEMWATGDLGKAIQNASMKKKIAAEKHAKAIQSPIGETSAGASATKKD